MKVKQVQFSLLEGNMKILKEIKDEERDELLKKRKRFKSGDPSKSHMKSGKQGNSVFIIKE